MSIIQRIRDKGALISAIVIALALLGFILTDYLSTRGGGFGGGSSTTLGTINGKKIDYVEFETAVSNQEKALKDAGQDIGESGRQRLIDEMWNQRVLEGIMEPEFDKLGFGVGKKELNDYLFGQNPPADLKQRFLTPQQTYDAAQAAQAINSMRNSPDKAQKEQLEKYLESVEFTRKQEKYTSLLANSVYFPKWFFEKQNAEVSGLAKISFARQPYASIADSTVKVEDREIEDYISKHKKDFKQEEARTVAYVTFDAAPTAADSAIIRDQLTPLVTEFANAADPASFVARHGSATPYYDRFIRTDNVQVPNADSIKKLADGQVFGPYLDGGNYTLAKMVGRISMPDTVKVRHILIKMVDREMGQVRDDSTAKKLVDSIKTAVAGGADFNALVLKYSDDGGSKDKQGEYTFSHNDNLVKEFYEAAFYKPVGTKEVVRGEDPQSYIGYHYIEVLSAKNLQPAYKIAYLSKQIFASDETESTAMNSANTFAAESPTQKAFDENIEKTLKAKGIQKMIAPDLKPNDYFVRGINGMSRTFIRAVYDAKRGDVLEPVLIGDKYIVAVVTEVHEEGTQTAQSARLAVEPVLRNKKKAELIVKKIGKVTTLEAAAATMGAAIETADSVRFIGGTMNLGREGKIIGASFNPANTGKVVAEPLEGQGGVFVLRVESVTATPVEAANIQDQKRSMEERGKQRALGANMGMGQFGGGQTPPPHIEVLKKASSIKDKRRNFY